MRTGFRTKKGRQPGQLSDSATDFRIKTDSLTETGFRLGTDFRMGTDFRPRMARQMK